MRLDIQYRIFEDPRQRMFLRENSYWYKYLNRDSKYFEKFKEEVKDAYQLRTTDRINNAIIKKS